MMQKDHQKETALNNYRPVTCLAMTRKILTAQMREINESLISREFFPEEQKGCRKTG